MLDDNIFAVTVTCFDSSVYSISYPGDDKRNDNPESNWEPTEQANHCGEYI